jgi:hypothetical protein
MSLSGSLGVISGVDHGERGADPGSPNTANCPGVKSGICQPLAATLRVITREDNSTFEVTTAFKLISAIFSPLRK